MIGKVLGSHLAQRPSTHPANRKRVKVIGADEVIDVWHLFGELRGITLTQAASDDQFYTVPIF